MNKIVDITPPHEPVAMVREMLECAPGCKAGVCILVREDGTLHWDMAGEERAAVLWALYKMIHELMEAQE